VAVAASQDGGSWLYGCHRREPTGCCKCTYEGVAPSNSVPLLFGGMQILTRTAHRWRQPEVEPGLEGVQFVGQ